MALWWLLPAALGVARSGACWACWGTVSPAELGGLLERLERLRPGKRQP